MNKKYFPWLAVFVGLIVAFLLLIAVEVFGALVHPVPPNFGGTKEEMCQHVARYPQWVLAVVVPLWALTAFLGTWTARKIGSLYAALTVGVLLMVALVFNISMLPYPSWFKLANLLVIPVAVFAGNRPAERLSVNPPAQS